MQSRFCNVDMAKRPSAEAFDRFAALLDFIRMDLSKPDDYTRLAESLQPRNADTVVMYVATAPSLFTTVCEQLGASGLNTPKTRVADLAYDHDIEALLQVRRMFNFLPLSNREAPPYRPTKDPADRVEMSLNTLVPENPNKAYDMKELIERVVDEGDFF